MSSVEQPMQCLTDKDLMPIAKQSSPEAMEQIAIDYLGITNDEMKIIQARKRPDVVMINFECLECWRNKYPGEKLFLFVV